MSPFDSSHAEPRLVGAQAASSQAPRTPWQDAASWSQLTLAMDATMLALSPLLAHALSMDVMPTAWMVFFSLTSLAILKSRGMYRPTLHLRVADTARIVATATALAAAFVCALMVTLTSTSEAAEASIASWALVTALLIGGRTAVAVSTRSVRKSRRASVPTLIVGAGRVGRLVASRLLNHPELGLQPVGFLDKEPLDLAEQEAEIPVLGASWDLDRIVAEHDIGQVIVTFSTAPTDVLLRVLRRCGDLGVRTSFVPRLYEQTTERLTVEHLGGIPLLSGSSPNPKGLGFSFKYALDRLGAALLLVMLAPLMVGLALAVWVSSGRPIFYRQVRVGIDGRPFEMLKFRSMRESSGELVTETTSSPSPSTDVAPGGVEGADRRTRVGTLLRRTSLDELPQLINVVRGEMSFVGPRPERPEFVAIFKHSIHRYEERHRVRSGITGWAQVNGLRGKTSLADRVEWDNYYIENWSPWFDFKICLLTLGAVLSSRGVE